jgi:hypothetical protein
MKLLVVYNPAASVISGVNEGIPITKSYPFFIVQPETNDDVSEATHLFAELFETYSKGE